MVIFEFGDISNLVHFGSEQNITYQEANIKTVTHQLNRKVTLVLHPFKRFSFQVLRSGNLVQSFLFRLATLRWSLQTITELYSLEENLKRQMGIYFFNFH